MKMKNLTIFQNQCQLKSNRFVQLELQNDYTKE